MAQQAIPFTHDGHSPGRRLAARVRLALPGTIVINGGQEPCLLDNLSLTGASLTIGGHAPLLNTTVVLVVHGIEAFGRVVWRKGPHFGLQFDAAVARDDVIRLRIIHAQFIAVEAEHQRRSNFATARTP